MGETPHIKIGKGLEEELHMLTVALDGAQALNESEHLNSKVLDGEKTNHVIRVELPRTI